MGFPMYPAGQGRGSEVPGQDVLSSLIVSYRLPVVFVVMWTRCGRDAEDPQLYPRARSLTRNNVSAVADVEHVDGAEVVRLADAGLVSMADIATRRSPTREGVRLLTAGERGSGGFPPPVTDPRSRYNHCGDHSPIPMITWPRLSTPGSNPATTAGSSTQKAAPTSES